MSKDEKIYQKILSAIVEHQLPPGSKLPEDKLADAFGVSRTGVRKVLQRLAIERFVTIQANRGAHVSRPTEQEANEVLETRILIEPILIPDISKNWNKSHSEEFRQRVEQEKIAEDQKDLSKEIQLTAQFHYELAKLSGNTLLAEFVEQLCYRSSLVVAAYGSQNSVSCDCGDHGELLDLLDKGESADAQTWMTHHLRVIKQSLNLDVQNDTPINFKDLFAK